MSQQPPVRSSGPAPPARPDASMSLLTNVMEHSLDDGYAEAAARRSEGGGVPRTLRARLGLALGLVLTGAVVTVGAAETRIAAPVLAKEREELIDRVQAQTRSVGELERTVESLREDVHERQRRALSSYDSGASNLAGLLAGATAVEGPGVTLVVDDAKGTGEGGDGPRESSGFSDTGRVRDRDLQRVVNGLWESGAEAVSINGHRLTALSAIRAAGDAVLVDNRPMVPPYAVLAVGDGGNLASAFQDSADGQYLQLLKEDFGIRTRITAEERVRLPAAPSLIVRTAEPQAAGADGGSRTGAADTEKDAS
ncbi:DUF881 domain-containing protein [Streptomyces sp. NPDC006984]|uniref:DUF881 domain-containing protein n=1 Tax=Streptomyces sp. NPDC006984 TaxID=3155463 RepID=UPI0033F599AF